jgi:Uma2 family endonuclease
MDAFTIILPNYTYNDYVNWQGQWELIAGIPYAMNPSSFPKHQLLATSISAEFRNAVKKYSNCNVSLPLDYKVKEDTILQPDVLVVCGDIKKKFLDFPPELVVEILSPSTALKDRHSKFSIYQSVGIKYYIIVSPDTEELEVFEYTEGAYELKQKGHSFHYDFTFADPCSASIDFSEIWK